MQRLQLAMGVRARGRSLLPIEPMLLELRGTQPCQLSPGGQWILGPCL